MPTRPYLRSGFYAKPELPAPDTPVGAVLAERRAALIADLGGEPSTAQLALVELARRTWCLVDAADAFLLSLPSIERLPRARRDRQAASR